MTIPKPKSGESQVQFAERCHVALRDSHPDTDERNAICFSAWRDSGKDKLEKLADRTFDQDRYEKVPDVAVFCEHKKQKRLSDGSVVEEVYDKAALEKIAARCNSRISDTKNFARLVEGHTPSPEESAAGASQPEVLGFEGPYWIGMGGNDDPRWCIYANEYWLKSEAHKRPKLPGRSVELWMHDDMGERFFDPIAALGAETPRLDLPMKYSQTEDGRAVQVARYSAFAGEGNVYAPAFNAPAKKERYEMMSPEEINQLAQAMAAPIGQAVAQAVIQALSEAPADQAGADMGGAEGDQGAGGVPGGPPPAATPPGPNDHNEADEVDDVDEEDGDVNGIDKKEEKDMPDKMSKKLADLELKVAKYERQQGEVEALKQTVAKISRDKITVERHSKLADLAREYAFRDEIDAAGKLVKTGLEKAVERCSKMSDQDFHEYCLDVVQHYQKLDNPRPALRTFNVDGEHGGPDDAKAKAAAVEAREQCEKFRREGKAYKFGDVLNDVRKAKGLSAIA